MPKNIQWIYGSYFNIQLIHMIHPRHTYNVVFENGWWGRLIHKILTKKTQKVGNSWNHENPYRGEGEKRSLYLPLQFHCSFPLFTSIFYTRSQKVGGGGIQFINMCLLWRKVGGGGRQAPPTDATCLHPACNTVLSVYMHEISLNEIKRSLSFYKMQNYIQRPTCRTFFSKSVLNYRFHSYAHSFSPHDQTVDLVCHPSLHM